MSLILRSQIGRRLTVTEMDGNFTYLEDLAMGLTAGPQPEPNLLVELTYTQSIDLLISAGFTEGTRYLITGFDVELYGGTDILVHGLLDGQYSLNGFGKFYNPRYDIINVWDSDATYSQDDLVVYGGKVWKNLTGSVGTTENYIFTLDNTNWELQEDYTNIDHYVIQWDQIEIGFADDYYCINSRYDSARNNYVRVGQTGTFNDRWFYCGINPIAAFGWGNNNITDCDIKDSYFNCLNILGTTTIYGVKMSNYSFMFDTIFRDSNIESLSFENESGVYSVYLKDSLFRNCKFENGSYFSGTFDNTDVQYLNLSNNSEINSMNLYNSDFAYINLNNQSTITGISSTASSFFRKISLNNQSYIESIQLLNSGFEYFNLDNESYLDTIVCGTSSIFKVNMTNNSWMQNLELSVGYGANSIMERLDLSNRSYITDVDLYDSTMYEIELNNYSYIDGSSVIDLWNSSMNYLSLDNHSRISGNIGLSSSYFKRINMTNRSRIQGNIDFQNNSRLEKLDLTNDAYLTSLYFYNNSYVENLDISNSNFTDINLDTSSYISDLSLNLSNFSNIGLSASWIGNVRTFGAYLQNIDANNSNFQAINLDRSYFSDLQSFDNSSLYQLDLNSTYLNLTALGTYSRNFPNGTSFRFGELKYQFDLTFNGTSGYGQTNDFLNIPAMLIPQDFYIEKVIIESSNLAYSGDSATFSFTMPGGLSPSTVEIAVSSMSGQIKVLDISNGSIIGIKADTNMMLTSFLTGGTDVTSGGIKMEVTLKNTRYFYD